MTTAVVATATRTTRASCFVGTSRNHMTTGNSSHVSASCQNPTWTIMALAWRSCDYLADQMKKGDL